MKILLIALAIFIFIFSGCEDEYDDIINPSVTRYTVDWAGINNKDTLDTIAGDSLFLLQIKVYPASIISNVNAIVKNAFGNVISTVQLLDNGNINNSDITAGDSVYSNHLIFTKEDPSGQYSISYLINGEQAALQYFYVEGEKFPPVLSNLNFPDSVQRSVPFVFSVAADDSNGLEDILLVYYELYTPDDSLLVNSQGISKFPMYDNGDIEIGDETEGDGIYSFKFVQGFPLSFPSGTWRIEFTAIDRSNRLSNKIIHYIEVY